MPAQTTVPPGAIARSAAGTRRTDGREEQRRVEFFRRRLVGGAGPFGAEAERKVDRRPVAGPDEGEHPATLGARDLGDNVRRRAEAVEAEALGIARHRERAVADKPGAEQGCSLGIAAVAAHGQAVALVGDAVVAIAAVPRVAGEERVGAQVLPPAPAIAAGAAGPAEPGDAHALPFGQALDARAEGRNSPHDLVPRHDRKPGLGEVAVHHMKIGAANTADRDPDQNFAGAGCRHRSLLQGERSAVAAINHGPHAGGVGHWRLMPR